MKDFAKKFRRLDLAASDAETKEAIRELFAVHGEVVTVDRFFGFQQNNKRYFLVKFSRAIDANRVINQYKLRSFGFNNVLLELELKRNEAS